MVSAISSGVTPSTGPAWTYIVSRDASALGAGIISNSGLGIVFTSGSGIVSTTGPGFHSRVFPVSPDFRGYVFN